MKLRNKILIILITTTTFVVTINTALFYFNTKSEITKQITARLQSSVLNTKERIKEIELRYYDRLALLASRTQMRISYLDYLQNGSESSLAKVKKITTDALNSTKSFEIVHFYNLNKEHTTSVNSNRSFTVFKPELSLLPDEEKIKFLKTSDDLKVWLQSPLILNNPGGLYAVVSVGIASEYIIAIQELTLFEEYGVLISMQCQHNRIALHKHLKC